MSQGPRTSGPQFHADRPVEQEAVRTTIVGGRPPGSGQPIGAIPRGMEVLIKKASVDPTFKETLLTKRAGAAAEIGLRLDPAEAMMLTAAPSAQLEAIIARTSVPQEHRRAFLGQAAAAMLAAIGVAASGCGEGSAGIRPEDRQMRTKGIQPDRPEQPPAVGGERPDRPAGATEKTQPTKGIRPDRPEPPPAKTEPAQGVRPDVPKTGDAPWE